MIPNLPKIPVYDKNWRKNPQFLRIRGITSEEIFEKKGQIMEGERITKNPKNLAESKYGIPKKDTSTKDKNLMEFGKYKDKTKEWVKSNDGYYWSWCVNNVKNFKPE